MSEYQYYEFQTVDRPLTEREKATLRSYSSRAVITSTRFTNHYEWGGFKGDPSEWMNKYFDAFVYVANWGTHELMLRLPRHVLAPKLAKPYFGGTSASVRVKGEYVILAFHSDSEDHEDSWDDDGSEWLPSMLPIRDELASGDYRVLYLAWLLAGQQGELEDDAREPPVPAGLGRLTASLKSFVDFLRIDADLISVAAVHSLDHNDAARSKQKLSRLIATLPEAEKTALLVRLVEGGGASLRAELLRRFRDGARASIHARPRTFGEIRDAAEARAQDRLRKSRERVSREQARRERAEAEAREAHFRRLAKREAATWDKVAALIANKTTRDYDEAVSLLLDLQALAVRYNRSDEAQARIARIRDEYAKRPGLLDRLRRAGLLRDISDPS